MGFLGGCEEEAEAFVVARREFLGFVADFLEAGDEGLWVFVVFDAVIVDVAREDCLAVILARVVV